MSIPEGWFDQTEEESRLLCPPDYETATGTFDKAGPYPENDPNDPDCAGCGCKRSEHVSPDDPRVKDLY